MVALAARCGRIDRFGDTLESDPLGLQLEEGKEQRRDQYASAEITSPPVIVPSATKRPARSSS